MEVNIQTIKSFREQHGWTQQQLADAAGLSLRTVQRIEKQGNASTESVLSLCAVLEITIDELKKVPKKPSSEPVSVQLGSTYWLIIATLLFGIIIGSATTYLWLL